MALSGRGFAKILIIAAILILAAIIFLNIYLDRKIESEAPGFIKSFSEVSGYVIDIDDIGIDPLFNLALRNIEVIDPSLQGAPVARIGEIILDPAIFSSLIERRLVINEILAQNPEIWVTKENIDNLRAAIDKFDRGETERASPFVIRSIRLSDALYHITTETTLSSDSLGVGIENSGREGPANVDLLGDLVYKNKKIDLEGTLTSDSGSISGFIELVTKDLGPEKLKVLSDDKELEAKARVNFEFSELMRAYGTVGIKHEDSFLSKDDAIISLNYDINYNPSVKTAVLDKLDLKMKGFLEGKLGGKAVISDGGVEVDISGSARAEDLGRIREIFPELEAHVISGSAEVKNLELSGSLPTGALTITGSVLIDNAAYEKTDDELLISGLNCTINLNQELKPEEGLPLTPGGKCTADYFNWPKTGEAKSISSNVSISSLDNFSKTNISLSQLSGSFMEGTVAGSLDFGLNGGGLVVSGLLTGNNLDFQEAPKTIIPFNIQGSGETVNAKFEGGSGEYKADISFSAKDISVAVSGGREFRLFNLRSLEDAVLSYKSGDETDGGTGQDTIVIKSSGLSYEDLTYEEYLIENGRVNNLLFTLAIEEAWGLELASEGEGFEVKGKDISLSSFSESLGIENSGRGGFSGHVRGQDGKFKSIEFPALEWDYTYRDGFIELSSVTADIGAIGRFETNDLNLSLGENGSYPIVSKFKDSLFTGLDRKVRTETLSGDLTINAPDSGGEEWDGNLEAEVLKVMDQPVKDIHIDVVPSENGLSLKNISGTFMGGTLSGDIEVDTTGPRAGIESDMELNGAVLDQKGMNVNIKRTEFDFTGLLPQNSLPEGTGEIKADGITITKNGASYVYKAGLRGETRGETLSIERGFISDRDSMELSFTGKMTDSLNEDRSLRLSIPGIQIPSAISILKPFMPEALSEAKTRGQADLELVFHKLFYPGQYWRGKLGVLRGEYTGMLAGTELVAKDIYGTVTIKEDADSQNPMGSYLNNGLKLSKSIYKKFLNSIKQYTASEDSDFLKIGSLEYGIIKIENIDCSLEVDREEINLKRLSSKAFRGGLYGTGTYEFQDPGSYNISFLFDEISLEAISERVSPNKEYITGRVNGLAWISGEGGDLSTIDGPFMFWATNSPKEPRRVGQALLDQLGARERLILGSSRGYDRGEISGYINDGVITFRVFSISNSVLGFQNLNIKADPRQNSISISHLISVIRELARRSLTGGPTIETN